MVVKLKFTKVMQLIEKDLLNGNESKLQFKNETLINPRVGSGTFIF